MRGHKTGITLIELLVVLGIVALLATLLATFQGDVFYFNRIIEKHLTAQTDTRRALERMISELRTAAPSEEGGYPIAAADASNITFFSDTDDDGYRERIRYFLDESTLIRGMIPPTGSPATYLQANEKKEVLADFVRTDVAPLFTYYTEQYPKIADALEEPIILSSIRLIRISITIDEERAKLPSALILQSSVQLRNLKDNL